VFYMFDQIVNLMKRMFPQTLIVESDLLTKAYNIVPYNVAQKGILINPVSKYFTYPLLSRIWNISSNYFNEYKNLRYIELYISLLTEKLMKLPYIAKLMRSMVVDKAIKKIKLNRVKLRKLDELHFPEQKVFKQKKFFTNVVQEVKNYTYYDPIIHDIFVLDAEIFIDEMSIFYEELLVKPDKLQEKFKDVIIWFNRPSLLKPNHLELQTVF